MTKSPGSLSSPHGIAVDTLGNIYVADTGNNVIIKSNSNWLIHGALTG